MFKKIKRLIQLSKKDPKALKLLEELSDEQVNAIPNEDDKAEFFPSGSEEEWLEQKQEDEGMKPWHDLLKNL